MKRIVCIVCLLTLLLSACSVEPHTPTTAEREPSYGIYQLTFMTEKISNDSVGDEWSFTYVFEGQVIKSGYQITCSPELLSFLPIDVEVREKDKIDDLGNGTLYVALCDGASAKTEVTVTETGGSYKGNTAVWEITCQVKLVGR